MAPRSDRQLSHLNLSERDIRLAVGYHGEVRKFRLTETTTRLITY